jgi:histidinol-phosphate aminotransferase
LREENVIVGNGSDDILNLIVRTFVAADAPAGFTFPSYSLYPVLVGIQDGRTTLIEFDRSMKLPIDRIAASTARAFFLTSPNAPTGVAFTNAEIEQILARFSGLLIVDEAYAPFAKENAIELLPRHPRLVVVRTLSKAYALAGIRVGYALAHSEAVNLLDRVRDSYNVSRLSQAAAIAAIGDPTYYNGVIATIIATRDAAVKYFTTQRTWFTYPSQANFIFTEPKNARGEAGPSVAKSAYDFLVSRKILVRYFASHALTDSFLRISVGTDEEMLVLQHTLDAWLQEIPNV